MNRFQGLVAFVTGGGHGIGRATSLRLASEGASIVVADIDTAAAQAVSVELLERGTPSIQVDCDVTDLESVKLAFAIAAAEFGHVDVLVNTAGGSLRMGPFEDSDDTQWTRDIDLNLVSVMRCVQAAIPFLRTSQFGGRVVTIGSVNGLAAFGGYSYSAAKAGLELLTRNFASEYGHEGIRFNLIAPGTINTRVWDHQHGAKERLLRMYPLGRIGEPEDIADAVAFLASDDARWITGITLPVDGGVMTGPSAVLPRGR